VRDLVAFVLRTGDLGGGSHFAGPNRALEGTRVHQRVQKSRPPGYEPEVSLTHSVDTPEFIFQLKGRIDGVLVQDGALLIEEIKTVARLEGITADPLHWAQARIYAHLYLQQHFARPTVPTPDAHVAQISQSARFESLPHPTNGADGPLQPSSPAEASHCPANFPPATIQLTYVELDSLNTVEFKETFRSVDLAAFFDSVVAEYLDWMREQHRWMEQRDQSIAALAFPFPYRRGQRAMAVAVYRNIKSRGRLFVEAPTGIGKTLSALFPAVKALGEGQIEKIFYLTAKTIGRNVAENSLAELRRAGLKLRAVSITARDKICFNNGQPCDVRACPYAIGYYDRIKAALRDSLQGEVFTRGEIEALARRHQVCPFELSLDLSVWADCVICDYNYALDPFVSLKRYFSGERCDFALLIDEAHNLVDRAREMFSAELLKEEILALKSAVSDELPACARVLNRFNARFLKFSREEDWQERNGHRVRKDLPEKLVPLLREFCEAAEAFLVLNQPSAFRQPLLDFYFRALAFTRIAELFDDRYLTLYEKESGRLRLFCLDPSTLLRDALENLGSAVFFSATLRPIEYYRESLGGDENDPALDLESPFSPDALHILLHHRVPTRLRDRERGYDEIADSLAAMAGARRGNYLVYFPSYEYLRQVLERFRAKHPGFHTETQTTGMSESAREEFLNRFQSARDDTLIAFAVLGGVFGEGIDLVGERLIGVAIVGVGLPQVCVERDLIREHWQARGKSGFDFSYTYPGMNRVLQAAGRVIRSETDRGLVLLLDERFARHPYPLMFPPWWAPRPVKTPDQILESAANFWGAPTMTHEAQL
jgi:DNA excision repair protein ERCC-2